MRLARTTVAAAVVVAAITCAALPAAAQTEEDCKNAVWKAQEAMEARFDTDNDGGGHVETLLAQAGEAGLQGDYKKCLEIVRDAEGAAGLTNLLRENESK